MSTYKVQTPETQIKMSSSLLKAYNKIFKDPTLLDKYFKEIKFVSDGYIPEASLLCNMHRLNFVNVFDLFDNDTYINRDVDMLPDKFNNPVGKLNNPVGKFTQKLVKDVRDFQENHWANLLDEYIGDDGNVDEEELRGGHLSEYVYSQSYYKLGEAKFIQKFTALLNTPILATNIYMEVPVRYLKSEQIYIKFVCHNDVNVTLGLCYYTAFLSYYLYHEANNYPVIGEEVSHHFDGISKIDSFDEDVVCSFSTSS